MTKWNSSEFVTVAGGGSADATLPFAAPAPGALLWLVAASSTVLSTPSGWDVVESAVEAQGLYLWSKTADGSETAVVTTRSVADAPVAANLFAFPAATDVLDTNAEPNVPRSGVPATGLSGLSADPKLLLHVGAFSGVSSALPTSGQVWGDDTITEAWDGEAATGTAPSITLLIGYLEDSTLTGWGPTVFLADSSGYETTTARITAALALPTSFGPPDGAVDAIVPATVGNDDGSVTISWDDVPTATRYEAGLADGHDQTTFVVVEPDATSPYTFTDLGGGDYTVAVRAVRE